MPELRFIAEILVVLLILAAGIVAALGGGVAATLAYTGAEPFRRTDVPVALFVLTVGMFVFAEATIRLATMAPVR